MGGELRKRAQSEVEPVLDDPRPGEETEVIEKGGKGGETKRARVVLFAPGPRDGEETEKVQEDPSSSALRAPMALDPRDGEETETTERGGGSTGRIAAQVGPRDGDETTPIRESPLGPPVRV